jgi:TonB family protein
LLPLQPKNKMDLTRQEENKNRIIAGTVTSVMFLLLLLFFILFQIVTPNPPFPESGAGGGGQQLALGMMMAGNDNIDFGSMGKATDVVASAKTKEEVLTDPEGEAVPISEQKPEVKNETTVITPVKPKEPVKEETMAEKLAKKFKKNTGRDGGGVGDNTEAGENGAPEGDPFGKGKGGTGTGGQGGNGPGDGPGGGPGSGGGTSGGYAFDLGGRAILIAPRLPKDTREEGKVVVEITVDREGNVIEASPNGRGTTTNSAILKAKAKQAALNTKFNVSGKFEEQRGTITIVFSFD